MSAEKNEEKEPSQIGIYLVALALAITGAILGVWYMMSFPPQAFSSIAEREKALEERGSLAAVPGDAFYVAGPILRSRSWEEKRRQFLGGGSGTLEISSGELNAWFASSFRGGMPPKADDANGMVITPGTPNVAVSEDGVLYLNLPAEFTAYSIDAEHTLSAKGAFKGSNPVRFDFKELHVGGARMPLPGLLGSQIAGALMKGYSSSEEFVALQDAWSRVVSVEIVGGGLRFTLQ